jgi:hypothetical protein
MRRRMDAIVTLCLLCCLALGAAPLRAEWIENGVKVFSGINTAARHEIISDGAGGAIIAWSSSIGNIHAQRIDPSGVLLWGSNGILVCGSAGSQSNPQLVPDGAGGAIISWSDNRPGNPGIYAQWIDANGTAQWTAGGNAVCASVTGHRLISDDAGGAIIGYCNGTAGSGDIYVQRIGADGAVLWGTNGVAVCATEYIESDFDIASDGAHGAIVALVRNYYYASAALCTSRIGAGGSVRWERCWWQSVVFWPGNVRMVYSGFGDAMLTWVQSYGPTDDDIWAQRIDTAGTVAWSGNRGLCTAAGYQGDQRISADGSGGAIVAWNDSRTGTADIYAQRITGTGTVLWTADGIPVCAAANFQGQCTIVSDGAGGAILGWCDARVGGGEDYDIYAQRIDANGASLWTADGVIVCDAAGAQNKPAITYGGAQGAILAWQDKRTASTDLYVGGGNPTVATLLQSCAAEVVGGCAELSWVLSEAGTDMRFFIERATAFGGEFEEIANPKISRSGLSFGFADCSSELGGTVRYRVDVEDDAGRKLLFETDAMVFPAAPLALFQNRPNPFNPSTTIGYYLPAAAHVMLEIYDPAGGRIARLVDGFQAKGSHETIWDGKNDAGVKVGSGVYFYRLAAGKVTLSKKLVLLK